MSRLGIGGQPPPRHPYLLGHDRGRQAHLFMPKSDLAARPPGSAPAAVTPARLAAAAVVLVGSAALLARPWLVRLPVDPVTLLVALFVVLGVVGATWPLPAPADADPAAATSGRSPVDPALAGDPLPEADAGRGPLSAWLVLGIGVGAFGVGRLLAVGTLPVAPLVFRSVALNTLAAVAEEAFYRRLAYGVARVWGPAVAVVASAGLFAAVHVTVWGWAVLPLDLAAGLVLGWQRWASGRWSVPAATHAAANVLAIV